VIVTLSINLCTQNCEGVPSDALFAVAEYASLATLVKPMSDCDVVL
jgi:hypothetical protein